jgi:hypothetical protein
MRKKKDSSAPLLQSSGSTHTSTTTEHTPSQLLHEREQSDVSVLLFMNRSSSPSPQEATTEGAFKSPEQAHWGSPQILSPIATKQPLTHA